MPPHDITETVTQFFAVYPSRQFKRGEVIIFPDGNVAPVAFLESGLAGQYDVSDDGTRVILNLFKPGAFFPMSSALNRVQNPYFFEALTDTTVRMAPAEVAATWLESEPAVALDLLKRVYRGTDGLLARMALLMAGTAHRRIVHELWIMAERFGKPQPDGGRLITITEHQLAHQTGLARETVSRELTALKRAGVLSHKRGGLVIWVERLT